MNLELLFDLLSYMNRYIILYKSISLAKFTVYRLDFCVQDLQIALCGVPMLLRLKVSVYNIKAGPSVILKAPLDYNLYILLTIVSLDYILVLYLISSPKNLFVSFTLYPLY